MTTQQPRHSEPSVNNQLGDLLREMLFGCRVRSENTQLVAGRPGLQLDNLITSPGRAPVVAEAEYEALGTAEGDAAGRLGLPVIGETHPVEAAIALRYPDTVRFADNLRPALAGARLSYAVLYQDGGRFPETGWLNGAVSDLADLIRLVSIPQKAVDAAADALQQGIERAADILGEMAQTRPNFTPAIARLLGMADVPQTRRMAGAILANALVFHQRIAGMHDSIRPLRLVCGPDVPNPQSATLGAWKEILDINYWAIFAIARDILTQLPDAYAAPILTELRETAQNFDAAGVDHAHDLTGQIFQRLIADRKYLATFYTRPASAALLARMAMSKLEGVDWSDASAIGKLRVGDFACGTGALLSAMYEQVVARHANAGGDPAQLHRAMMEEVLYGCDVMPSAIHITGSTLSGMQPSVGFNQSRLYTMAYGRQGDGSVKIGSLELLQSSQVMTLFNTSDPALRTGSVGEETAAQVNADVPDESFDMVIMNPPFTRNTTREGATADAVAAAFAAFEASEADQRAMAGRMGELRHGTSYHGNAGVASAFAGLAHKKLKPGGVLALVLPLSAAVGIAWQKFREMLAQNYTELSVLSIAANGDDMAFSSDTGMAECLVIARKIREGESSAKRVHFATLHQRPLNLASASAVSKGVEFSESVRRIEDGPYGGTRISIGNEFIGEMLTAPCSPDGDAWAGVRISDYSLAQTAYYLSLSQLNLPGSPHACELSTTSLVKVGELGLYHLDIVGAPPRGPFNKVASSPTATYPALWNHDAKNETRLICVPDSQLEVRPGMETKATALWAKASRVHINAEYTFGAQPLAVAFTERESLGGSAWPNVIFNDERFDYAYTVWGNSTLGLLAYWWHSSRQQSSKARMTIRQAETLPVLDLRALSEGQLAAARRIFDEFRELDLLPAYLADADPNRALLDMRVVFDLLGFDGEIYRAVRRLAAKWCAEPSVHGGKRRSANARYVE
ncbi:MAG: hypothetical protein F4X27_09465 [Chloroflexi bacterium]|nr:hypothetical protein [Chloroflexota bacterium]